MRFTRRRFDFYMIAGTIILTSAHLFVGSGRAFGVLGIMVLLSMLRFKIPREGVPMTPIRDVPRPVRQLIWWSAIGGPLLAIVGSLGVVKFNPPVWLVVAIMIPLMAFTFWLAHRADQAQIEVKGSKSPRASSG